MTAPFPLSLFSGFAPTSISGLQLWLDASNRGSITQVAGAVSQWNDLSGNGRNATQGTGAAQPTVQTAAQNGLDTLRFTAASSQRMVLGAAINVDSAFTILFVARHTTTTANDVIVIFGNTSNANFDPSWWVELNGNRDLFLSNSSGYVATSQILADTAHHVVVCDATGTTQHVYWDGSDITGAFTASAAYSATFDAIGYGGSYTNGDIAEIILYNHVLSATDRTNVTNYLRNKWGV